MMSATGGGIMKLLTKFEGTATQKSSIAEAILKSGIAVNIERAKIEGDYGWVLLSVDKKAGDACIKTLTYSGVSSKTLENSISHNPNECIDCGRGISICQKEVFSFDKNWKFCINEDKCAAFCPQRALSVEKDD